ncbi:unnamed protein product [Moneuplotes crassus]|uniref:Uncharacterized protein n=1 Tax=Euplotes crassus TaxID=5936 RepID=A0AAD1U6Y6_EUPCR|nr:unnamed protein product [Moneuplotes crassus]
MARIHCKTLKWTYARLKNRDMFKQTLSLTYRGKDNFTSLVGSIGTVFIMVIVVVYSILLFRTMFNRTDVSWNHNTIRNDYDLNQEGLVWGEDDPQFKIFWSAEYPISLDNRKSESISNSTYTYLSTNISNPDSIIEADIPYDDCDGFFPMSLDNIEGVGSVAHCPKFKGKKLFEPTNTHGDRSSILMQYRQCRDDIWNNYCAPQQIIDYLLESTYIQIYVMNRYVDLNDIDNPIKDYLEVMPTLYFNLNKHVHVNMKLRKHEVILEDTLFTLPWGGNDPIHFNSIEDFTVAEQDFVDETRWNGFVTIYITQDSQIDQHRRKVLNFLEVTGIIGGIFEIFEVGFGIIIGLYSSYIFKRDLMNDIEKYEEKFQKMEKSISKLEENIQRNNQPPSSFQENNLPQQEEDLKEESKNEREESKIFEENFLLNKPQIDIQHNNMEYDLQKLESQRIPIKKLSKLAKKIKEEVEENNKNIKKFIWKKDEPINNLDQFNTSLDCLNIIYMIKKLRRQTMYLLQKDPDYSKHFAEDSDLDIDFTSIYCAHQDDKIHPQHIELTEQPHPFGFPYIPPIISLNSQPPARMRPYISNPPHPP